MLWSSKYVSLKKICGADERKKAYFSTNASTHRIFKTIGIDTHPIGLNCHQKIEKNSPTGRGNIGARSWKHAKSHGRLDPTWRMRQVVHALNRVPTRAKPPVFHPMYSLWKRDIFPFDHFTGYKKNNENQLGSILPYAPQHLSKYAPLQCSLTRASYGVRRLRARVQQKSLSSWYEERCFKKVLMFL